MEFALFQTAKKLDLEVVSNVLKDGDKINGEVASYMIACSFRMLENANLVALEWDHTVTLVIETIVFWETVGMEYALYAQLTCKFTLFSLNFVFIDSAKR